MMDREAALRLLAKHRTSDIVVRGWTEWDHIDRWHGRITNSSASKGTAAS